MIQLWTTNRRTSVNTGFFKVLLPVISFFSVMYPSINPVASKIFEKRKSALGSGYTLIHETYSHIEEYDKALDTMIEDAQNYFDSICEKKNKAVIFDIDYTTLDNNTVLKCIKGGDKSNSKVLAIYDANKKLLALYNKLSSQGFKIFFITSRPDRYNITDQNYYGYDWTVYNLTYVGYEKFERVFCMPIERYVTNYSFLKSMNKSDESSQILLTALWKAEIRLEIQKTYEIVATFDDVSWCLHGYATGCPFLMPRFFNTEIKQEIKNEDPHE